MINLDHVQKYYNRGRSNEIHVINDVTLELPDRGMVAVFGRSGCGKTTLLNVIGGLDTIAYGKIKIDGNDVSHDVDTLRNVYVGYVFQNYNLNAEETVFDNVADALKLCGVRDEKVIKDRVTAALAAVDMSRYSGRTPDTLSGGQQQRVAIARAIVKNPRVILADEPTGNLDEANTVLIMDLLHKIAKEHLVVLVTHEESLVDHYCDMVVELADGKVVGTRYNESASGYKAKDKNAIYLGELDKTEQTGEAVSVEYYGEKPVDPIKLKVVNIKGKTYLKIDTENVRYLDETAEIKLFEGVFEDGKNLDDDQNAIDDLPPLKYADNAPIGRLFGFKSSIVSGYKSNFDKKKKGRRFLRIVMALFAIVFTFMTANFATALREISSVNESFDHNVFYVFVKNEEEASKFNKGSNGIDGIYLTDYTAAYGLRPHYFMMGAFETSDETNDIGVSATGLDSSISENLNAVAGKNVAGAGEAVISTAIANKIISTLNRSYIKNYSDFLGLFVSTDYGGYSFYDYSVGEYATGRKNRQRIVGVVESEEPAVYFSPVDFATRHFIDKSNLVIAASTIADIKAFDVPKGTALCVALSVENNGYYVDPDLYYGEPDEDDEEQDQKDLVGDTVMIRGQNLAVEKFDLSGDAETSKAIRNTTRARFYNLSYVFVLNDEDVVSLAKTYGKTDAVVYYYPSDYDYYESKTPDPYGSNARYLMLHSNDPAATEKYIKSVVERYTDPYVYSPEYFYQINIEGVVMQIITQFIALAVMFTIMVLCMYFIMRSSLMSRIKEIGIYRAIGAKKGNIVFKFFVESLVLITLTVFFGYLFGSAFLGVLSMTSTIISSMFFYPFWVALIVLATLYGVCSLCGILPVISLLKSTPSEILSKYDV